MNSSASSQLLSLFKIEATKRFTPGLEVVDSSQFGDRNPQLEFPFKIKPDVSVYCGDPTLPHPLLTDSSLAEIFIEFKWQTFDDPFCPLYDTKRSCSPTDGVHKSFLRETQGGSDTLGQITSYAAAQLGSQFRTHLYSVFIVKGTARILRWDRSGTIVTEPIKYNESPLLVEFFRRYSKASPEMRGKDSSASAVTPTEALVARQTLGLGDTIPLVKLVVPAADGSSRHFITSTPRATLYAPPGRATRGFPAYDSSQGTVVYLKDSWRIDLPDIHAEGQTYATLEAATVRNIPRCLVSGDISTDEYHATKTNSYATRTWACHSYAHFLPHRHYRLVLDIVGHPLTSFSSSYEMVAVVRDALIGAVPRCNFSGDITMQTSAAF